MALASATDLWITPDAYFAVIAPEGATAILKHDPGEAATIADRLRLRPQDLLELGIVRGIARLPTLRHGGPEAGRAVARPAGSQ